MSPFPSLAAAQSPNYESMKKTTLPSISSKSTAHLSNPCYEELVNYLMEQAVSLLVCKYKFETNLAKQLGFISFPITETLMDLLLGFKKVEGSHICLSSAVDWSCLLQKLEEAQWERQVSQQVPQQESQQVPQQVPQQASQQVSQQVPQQASRQVSQQVSRQASQNDTSHHTASRRSTSQHSRGSYIPLLKPAIVMDQEVAKGEHLHSELLSPQLLTPQENNTADEQEPRNLSEPNFSMSYRAGVGSKQYEQVVAMGESQSSEEEEEDKDEEFGGDESET